MQATDTSAIQRLVGKARGRIRRQWALEGAATATILAAAAALVAVFLIRIEAISTLTGLCAVIGAGVMIAVGALISAMRRLDDEVVARRIDRASDLSDRLSTAIAFARTPMAGEDEETRDFMLAAIRDGVRVVPRAKVIAAAPYAVPKDGWVALGFVAISLVAAGLALPTVAHDPRVFYVEPAHAPPGSEVVMHGENLFAQLESPDRGAAAAHRPFIPRDGAVYLGDATGRPVQIVDWSADIITVRVPADAKLGETVLSVYGGTHRTASIAFGVVDPRDVQFHKADSVALEPDEKAYVEAIIAELKNVALRDKVPELDEFAKKIEKVLADAEEGKLTKEQVLEALQQAEDALNKNAEPKEDEVKQKMADMGKELKKDELTKPLGEALEKNDLEKAKQEMEKLAEKLDQKTLDQAKKDLEQKINDPKTPEAEKQDLQKKLDELEHEKPLTEKQKDELAKKMDDVAKQMEKQEKQDEKKQSEAQQQMEKEIKRLEKKKQEAKNDQERLTAERQLQKKKDELQQLKKDEDNKQSSEQRQALKRLTRDMEKAAENLQKPQKSESEQEQQEREQQASQKIKDAARETGRVDKDQRKQATQRKMSSQMDDLREAMRRAKQKGNKGPNDPFNKQGKNQNFAQRAKGQKGQGQGAWKPGQGQQGQGQGQGQQPGGQGTDPGGESWGTEHDDNLTGQETAKSGNTKDQDLQGTEGGKGSSKRETILAAAQKGFASVGYQKVYADYQRIVEEVMRTEKLPSSYKYYVKRYFAKIHPSMEAAPSQEPNK